MQRQVDVQQAVQPKYPELIFGRVLAAHVNTDPELKRLYTVGPGHVMGGVRMVLDTVVRPPASQG